MNSPHLSVPFLRPGRPRLPTTPSPRTPSSWPWVDETVRRSEFDRHVQALEARGMGSRRSRRAKRPPRALSRRARPRPRGAIPRASLKAGASAEEEEHGGPEAPLRRGPLPHQRDRRRDRRLLRGSTPRTFACPRPSTLRQILVSSENEARDMRRRLQKDPKSFEPLAQSRSRSPEAEQGGPHGHLHAGRASLRAREPRSWRCRWPGSATSFRSPLGFHVLRVDARQAARERRLEECRADIRSLLTRQKSDQATRQFVRGLLARAKVNHEAAQPSRPS